MVIGVMMTLVYERAVVRERAKVAAEKLYSYLSVALLSPLAKESPRQ